MSYAMAHDLIRPAVTLYRETDPKIDMMAAVTAMNRIAQVPRKFTPLFQMAIYMN